MEAVAGPQLVRRPLVVAAFGFTFGVVAAPGEAVWADVATAVLLAVVAIGLARRGRIIAQVVSLIAFFFAGQAAATLRLPPLETISATGGRLDASIIVEGDVVDAPRMAPDSDRLIIDVVATATAVGRTLTPARGRVEIWIPAAPDAPGGSSAGASPASVRAAPCGRPGDRVRFWGRMQVPEPSLLPGRDSPRLVAARRGVSLVGSIPSPRHCMVVAEAVRPGLRVTMERFRGAIHDAIDRALPPGRAAVVRAFATGERAGISRSVAHAFNDSGLSHLLAVSGLNLAIIAGLFAICLAWVLRWFPAVTLGFGALRLASVIAIPFVVLYTLIVGASPSAIRAAIMVIALLGAQLVRRISEPWSALALALLVMLAWDPASLGDVSFQLSFAAVAALLRLYPAMRARWAATLLRWPWWSRWPVDVALASAAATIGTAPLVARHFQRMSLAGLLANVPAAPLASLVLVPLSLAGGVLGTVHDGLAQPVLQLAGYAAEALTALATTAASMPGAAIRVPQPSALECILFYVGTIGLSLRPASRRARRIGFVAFMALAVIFTTLQLSRRWTDDLRVTFLPVGQGDGAVVEFPGGHVMVVDTGPAYGDFSAAETVMIPYLRYRRITSIDTLVLSHAHADHTGGLATFEREFDIAEVWFTDDVREVESAVLEPMARLKRRWPIQPRSIGGVQVTVLSPVTTASAAAKVNDGSIVLRLDYGRRAIVLAGDAERDAEASMVDQSLAPVDVLKAGHHGSRTSSTDVFLERLRPAHVVVPVGRANRFGFPHPEVLARFARIGAQVWRTDEHGEIVVTTDGDTLTVTPHRQASDTAPR